MRGCYKVPERVTMSSLLGSPCMPWFGVSPPVCMGVDALCPGVPKMGTGPEDGRDAGVLKTGTNGLAELDCGVDDEDDEGVLRAFGNRLSMSSSSCSA